MGRLNTRVINIFTVVSANLRNSKSGQGLYVVIRNVRFEICGLPSIRLIILIYDEECEKVNGMVWKLITLANF